MKTIAKTLVLSTAVIFSVSPFTQAAQAAPIQHEQITTKGDFQLPSETDTIKRNIGQSLIKQEKWLQHIELLAGQEKRALLEQFLNEYVSPDLAKLLEEPSLTWDQVDTTIYQSLVQSGVPFLAAKAVAHVATSSLKKM
ncbi:hypothetical protein [Bacillus sp. 179-C3.3 HS]|uniref:hypothetical protein n=1 Tax=Bacillus sp. 179-C3.3 HS TaxID=3232162 RepID=UPI00399FE035